MSMIRDRRVRLFADVPQLSEELSQRDIYLCPIRIGSGMRNKVLEAFSTEMAVVSTSLGCEGMGLEGGMEIAVADPYVKHWWELEKQDSYPSPDHSMRQFFRNQEKLGETRVQKNLADALPFAEVVIFAVRHQEYLELDPEEVVAMIGRPAAIVDCFGVLDDQKIRRYFELDCEVKGLGRGHVKRIKDEVQQKK